MSYSDPLFVGSRQRFEIIKTYQRLRVGGGHVEKTMVQRIVQELPTYRLDKNGGNSFIYKVIREYMKRRQEESSTSES